MHTSKRARPQSEKKTEANINKSIPINAEINLIKLSINITKNEGEKTTKKNSS